MWEHNKNFQGIQSIKKSSIVICWEKTKSISYISNKYGASKSYLYLLSKRLLKSKSINSKNLFERKEQKGLTVLEKEWIINNTSPPWLPLTIAKLNQKMNKIFLKKDRKRDIKYFLKKQFEFFI